MTHLQISVQQAVPANKREPLPTWDECELFCKNPKYAASELHQFIYAYDDADADQSALFMRRLELVLREQSQHTETQLAVPPGYALVPIFPTEQMKLSGFFAGAESDHAADLIYCAMVDHAITYAAPQLPQGDRQ